MMVESVPGLTTCSTRQTERYPDSMRQYSRSIDDGCHGDLGAWSGPALVHVSASIDPEARRSRSPGPIVEAGVKQRCVPASPRPGLLMDWVVAAVARVDSPVRIGRSAGPSTGAVLGSADSPVCRRRASESSAGAVRGSEDRSIPGWINTDDCSTPLDPCASPNPRVTAMVKAQPITRPTTQLLMTGRVRCVACMLHLSGRGRRSTHWTIVSTSCARRRRRTSRGSTISAMVARRDEVVDLTYAYG
jgi:hypothetical protein